MHALWQGPEDGRRSGAEMRQYRGVHDDVENDHECAKNDVIAPFASYVEAGPQDVMLKESLWVWLDPAELQESLFPWGKGATQIEDECRARPYYGEGMNP
jgi:hypothetical protein